MSWALAAYGVTWVIHVVYLISLGLRARGLRAETEELGKEPR